MASTADLVNPDQPSAQQPPPPPLPFKSMTLRQRLHHIRTLITIEPTVIPFLMSGYILSPAVATLEIETACTVNFEYNATICETMKQGNYTGYKQEFEQVNALRHGMQAWSTPLAAAVPLALVLFFGAFSDRHRIRKPFFIVPICGSLVGLIGLYLCVLFRRWWPVEVVPVFESVVPSLFGGSTMLLMAVYAYLADVSDLETRTLRLGILTVLTYVNAMVANPLSSVVFNMGGYNGSFGLSLVLMVFALGYCIWRMEEPHHSKVVWSWRMVREAFDVRQVVDTFKLLTKKTPGNNRLLIGILMLVLFVISVTLNGESSVLPNYAYALLNWTPADYQVKYSTVASIVKIVGTAVGLPLLTKLLKLSDPIIIIVAFANKILANCVTAMATTAEVFICGQLIAPCTGLGNIGLRSMDTKVVLAQDLAKAQSLFALIETLGGLAASQLYNLLQAHALKTHTISSNFFLYIGVILNACCLAPILYMYFKMRSKSKKTPMDNGKTNEEIPIDNL